MNNTGPDCWFVNFLLAAVILLVDEISYPVSRQPLGPSSLTHHKVNICHQLIVEHYWISRKGKKQKETFIVYVVFCSFSWEEKKKAQLGVICIRIKEE